MSLRGSGAFMEGVLRGMKIGKVFKEEMDEKDLKTNLKQAQDDARVEREGIVSNSVTSQHQETPEGKAAMDQLEKTAEENGTDVIGIMGGAVPGVDPEAARDTLVDRHNAPTAFAVKGLAGRSFGSENEARQAAEQQAPDFQTMYSKRAKDILVNHFTERGDLARAKAATEWADGLQGKQYLKESANVLDALNTGDSQALNESFARLGEISGNKQDIKAAFHPADPSKVLIERMDPKTGQPVQRVMSKGDLMRQFAMQYNPEKGLEMHIKQLDAQAASQAKMAERMFDHKLDIQRDAINNEDKATREAANITLKAKLEQQGEDFKNGDKIDGNVKTAVKHVEDFIGSSATTRLKTLEKERETAATMDPDRVPEIEAQMADIQTRTRQIQTAAGEVASFATRTQNPVLMDRGAAWHASVAEQLVAARKGEKNDIGLTFDSSTGKLVEVYKENGKLVPVTMPQDINPVNPLHQAAIVGMNNVNPASKQPFVDEKTFQSIKADYVKRGGKVPGEESKPAAAKPSQTAPKPTGPAAPVESHPARGGILANRPSYQRQAVAAAANNS